MLHYLLFNEKTNITYKLLSPCYGGQDSFLLQPFHTDITNCTRFNGPSFLFRRRMSRYHEPRAKTSEPIGSHSTCHVIILLLWTSYLFLRRFLFFKCSVLLFMLLTSGSAQFVNQIQPEVV